MEHWHRMILGAAAIAAVVSVASCDGSHDLIVDAVDVAKTVGDQALRDHSVEIRIPDGVVVSRSFAADVAPSTIRDVIGTHIYELTWADIQESINKADENTDGPIRAAIVKSACDTAFQREADLDEELDDNFKELGYSPQKEEASAAFNALAAIDGILIDKKPDNDSKRAAVAAGCYVADQAFDTVLKEASGS